MKIVIAILCAMCANAYAYAQPSGQGPMLYFVEGEIGPDEGGPLSRESYFKVRNRIPYTTVKARRQVKLTIQTDPQPWVDLDDRVGEFCEWSFLSDAFVEWEEWEVRVEGFNTARYRLHLATHRRQGELKHSQQIILDTRPALIQSRIEWVLGESDVNIGCVLKVERPPGTSSLFAEGLERDTAGFKFYGWGFQCPIVLDSNKILWRLFRPQEVDRTVPVTISSKVGCAPKSLPEVE